MRRDLKHRLARWEALIDKQAHPPKRAVPDWLQAILERQGYVFHNAGQVIFSPNQPGQHRPDAQNSWSERALEMIDKSDAARSHRSDALGNPRRVALRFKACSLPGKPLL